MTQRVSLSLGSNLGDREMNLRQGVQLLREQIQVNAVSSVYETAPVGPADQPAFLNLAVTAETDLPAHALLLAAQSTEQAVGRRPTYRWGPRVLDIDILLLGDQVIDEADVIVPHPRMPERAFVLIPLAEIAPEAHHPILNRSIQDLAALAPGRGTVERWRP